MGSSPIPEEMKALLAWDGDPKHPGAHVRSTPAKAAVVMAGSGATLTFAELDGSANQVAHLFRDLGLGVGDHVAFCLENRLEYLPLCIGAEYAGLLYTPINTRFSLDEINYLLSDCGARVFVTSEKMADIAAAITVPPALEHRYVVDGPLAGYEPLAAALAGLDDQPEAGERIAGRGMLYSSGTTGKPKGVLVPVGRDPVGRPDLVARAISRLFGLDADCRYLSPAPLYHGAPLKFCLTTLGYGGTVVVMERFDAEAMLAAIERHRITHVQVVPTMLLRLLKLPEEVLGRYDTSSLQMIVTGSAPCPAAVKDAVIARWGPIIHEYYAGTEGIGLTYCDAHEWMAHRGTVGRQIFGEIHICDEDGKEVPPGTTGTVYLGGVTAFGYHSDPEKTAKARHPLHPNWATYGDIGHVDADGYLYLSDRKANMIISGGVNIYPRETEDVLTFHPKVADVAVFGIPHPEMGEEVKAVVQPVDWADAGEALEAELIAFCRSRIAHYKCPRSIDFEAELPRHPTGKLYKRLIRDRYLEAAGFASGVVAAVQATGASAP